MGPKVSGDCSSPTAPK